MEREIILSKEEIENICKDIASKLDERFSHYKDDIPVFVGVLKGSLNFMMDLLKYVKSNIITDYIQVSSYEGTNSTGAVILKKDLSTDIRNKRVVIIEDVIDTGLTMHYLTNYLKNNYHPKEIIVVTLFDKTLMRKVKLEADYTGKVLTEDKFLIGYGLDYNELCRNIPYVFGAQKEEIDQLDQLLAKNK